MSKDSFITAQAAGPLYGTVRVGGAKNMVTKVLVAALGGERGRVTIKNIPFIGELAIVLALCERLGVKYQLHPDNSLELEVGSFTNPDVRFDRYMGNRISILFAGPVLSKLGRANVSKPAGCDIGERKIDFHLAGLEKFGVDIIDKGEYYQLKLKQKHLVGTEIDLPFPSVGATENLIITASVARGRTVIRNAAVEPEIMEMVAILQRSGVPVELDANRTFTIEGGPHQITDSFSIIPDRIEAFSWACVALATRGDVFVQGARQEHMTTPLGILESMGAGVEIRGDGIRFYYRGSLKPAAITTQVYPGFATDFQQPFAALLSQVKGASQIHETIFDNRFQYFKQLSQLAKSGRFSVETNCPSDNACRFQGKGHPHLALIEGPAKYQGGHLQIDDLRAGFALLITGLLADEKVMIYGLDKLYRGYERPIEKLVNLGANISISV